MELDTSQLQNGNAPYTVVSYVRSPWEGYEIHITGQPATATFTISFNSQTSGTLNFNSAQAGQTTNAILAALLSAPIGLNANDFVLTYAFSGETHRWAFRFTDRFLAGRSNDTIRTAHLFQLPEMSVGNEIFTGGTAPSMQVLRRNEPLRTLSRYDDVVSSTPRMHARDFSGRFDCDAIQQITLLGLPIGGHFKLSAFPSTVHATIDHNADTALLQSRLEALPSIGSGNVAVTGLPGGPWTIRFKGNLASREVPDLIGDFSALQGVAVGGEVVTRLVGRNWWDQWAVVGDFRKFLKWDGPIATTNVGSASGVGYSGHCLLTAEMLPEHLLGRRHSNLPASTKGTFKVVRAVSERECLGFYDGLTAYDNAFISVGPCHWTMGIIGQDSPYATAVGELPGFLAYLESSNIEAFESLFKQHGAGVATSWGNDGERLFDGLLRIYRGWFSLQTEDSSGVASFRSPDITEREGNLFKSWPWFYRFSVAGRSNDGYRRSIWDMARIRIRDLLLAPCPGARQVIENGQPPRVSLVGEVFRSEKSVALLLQWHVRKPGNIFFPEDERITRVIREASLPDTNPANYDHDDELALINALLAACERERGDELRDRSVYVANWPNSWGANPRGYRLDPAIGSLSDERTFTLDATSLPTAPFVEADVEFIVRVAEPGSTQLKSSDSPSSTVGCYLVAKKGQNVDESGRLIIDRIALAAKRTSEEEGSIHALPIQLAPESEFSVTVRPHGGDECVLHIDASSTPTQASVLHVENPEEVTNKRLSGASNSSDIGSVQLVFGSGLTKNGAGDLVGPLNLELSLAGWPTERPLIIGLASDTSNQAPLSSFTIDGEKILFTLENVVELIGSLGVPIAMTKDSTISDGLLSLEYKVVDGNWNLLAPKLLFKIGGALRFDLGSGLAIFEMELLDGHQATVQWTPKDGLTLILPDRCRVETTVSLDLFKEVDSDRVANNSWGNGKLLISISREFTASGEIGGAIATWTSASDFKMKGKFFESILSEDSKVTINGKSMTTLAGKVLGAAQQYATNFNEGIGGIKLRRDGDGWKCNIPIGASVGAGDDNIFSAKGWITVLLGKLESGNLKIDPTSFRCSDDSTLWVFADNEKECTSAFSEIMSFHIPHHTAFRFSADPNRPFFSWDEEQSKIGPKVLFPDSVPKLGTEDRMTVCVPSRSADVEGMGKASETKRFTFDAEVFKLHSAGIDLTASVRAESVPLGDKNMTGFSEPLAVKSPNRSPEATEEERMVGTLGFKNSQLTHCIFESSAKLKYFDDAIATLRLTVSESESDVQSTVTVTDRDNVERDYPVDRLAIAGNLTISNTKEYHVPELFMTWQVSSLVLTTELFKKDGKHHWHSEGSMTGMVRFESQGGASASGESSILSDLFSGVTVGFENLNPVDLGSADFTVTFPPRSFGFAEVFQVDMRGIKFKLGDGSPEDIKLLGDIYLKNIPGIDADVKFGGVTLKPGRPPGVDVSMIGARLTLSENLVIKGEFEKIKNDEEKGFRGAFGSEKGVLPDLSGQVKLTQVATKDKLDSVPSIAVYLQAGVDISLFAGFFLRKLGAGVGIYQELRGLGREDGSIAQRIEQFVDDPLGLPHPGTEGAWLPIVVEEKPKKLSDLQWMLVAYGLITYGKFGPTAEHTVTCSLLVALNNEPILVVGVNVWLFTSPIQSEEAMFIARPAARGAIGFAPKEETLYGYFRTIRKPEMGKSAPDWLRKALDSGETTLRFLADSHGFLVEVGWPWETKFEYAFGEFGELEVRAGFRFGIYGGVISFGLNFEARVRLEAKGELGFGTRFGRAPVSLFAAAEVNLNSGFTGAISPSYDPFLLGDLAFSGKFECGARVDIKWKKHGITLLSIKSSASATLCISAAATMALDKNGIGLRADLPVGLPIGGYKCSGHLPIRIKTDKIDQVRKSIEQLLPPVLAPTQKRNQPKIAPADADVRLFKFDACWHYRYKVMDLGGKKYARVALFPAPGNEYPKPIASDPATTRYQVQLRSRDKFRGFLGDGKEDAYTWTGNTLCWSEDVDQVVFSKGDLLDDRDALPDRSSTNLATIDDLTLGDILSALPDPVVIKQGKPGEKYIDRSITLNTAFDPEIELLVDPRTQVPLASDADDHTSAVRSGANYSPAFRRDQEYDDHLRRAGAPVYEPPGDEPPKKDRVSDTRVLTKVEGNAEVQAFVAGLTQQIKDQNDGHAEPPGWLKTFFKDKVGRESELRKVKIEDLDTEVNLPSSTEKDWLIDELEGDAFIVRYCPDISSESLQGHLEVFFAGSVGLPSGVLLMESLEMLSDSKAEDKPTGDPALTYARRKYPLATALRIVLCFEITEADAELADPVPALLQLESDDGTRVEHRLAGQTRIIQSVTHDLSGRPNYNINVSEVFQDADRITFPFTVEMQAQRRNEAKSFRSTSPAELKEVYRIDVTRSVQARADISEVTVEYTPFVIEKESDDGNTLIVIQPQFGHIDDAPEMRTAIRENDWIEYKIVVRSVDRILVEATFPVQRRVPRILPPPTHAKVVQLIDRAGLIPQISYEFTVGIVNVPFDIDDTNPPQPRNFEPRLLYRWIPITVDGFYGIDQAPGVRTRRRDGLPDLTISQGEYGLPASRNIRFAGADMLENIRWDMLSDLREFLTSDLLWTSIEYQNAAEKIVEGALKVSLSEIQLQKLWETQPSPDRGLEFFVGFEESAISSSGITPTRSNLLRMRHGVLGPVVSSEKAKDLEQNSPIPESQVGMMFRRGNEVSAIEKLPSVVNLFDRFIPKEHVQRLQPQWRSTGSSWQNEPLVLEKTAARLCVLWNHMPPIMGAGRETAETVFNPVVGYRLHRVDHYLSSDYQAYVAIGGMPRRPESFIKTLPIDTYRDTPKSITVQGRGNWHILSQHKPVCTPSPKPLPIRWKPVLDAPDSDIFVEVSPTYLSKSLYEIANTILSLARLSSRRDDIRIVVRCHVPLQIASVFSAAVGTESQIREAARRFDQIRTSLSSETDAYGWLSAESLGLSCECRLVDRNDDPVSLQSLLDNAEPSEMLETLYRQVAKNDQFQNTLALFFVGQDERTVLNTFRLVHADLHDLWEIKLNTNGGVEKAAPRPGLLRSLRVSLIGEDPEKYHDRLPEFDDSSDQLTEAVIKEIEDQFGSGLNAWALDVCQRLHGSPGGSVVEWRGSVIALTDRGTSGSSDSDSILGQATAAVLPIDHCGKIEATLPIPDRWSHNYLVAIEYVQRYDWMLRGLDADNDQAGQPIDPKYVRSCDPILRTQLLVAHNALATPLPGGIQAIVFRHPADYAAQASADMKNAGQYSGQTTLLQYRIPPSLIADLFKSKKDDERASVESNPEEPLIAGTDEESLSRWLETEKLDGVNSVDWLSYRRWLEFSGHEISAGHDRNDSGDPDTTWRFDLIPNTEHRTVDVSRMFGPIPEAAGGVACADRIVYLDIPGQYQFRVLAYSTAGAVTSPIKTTGWVSPIYDDVTSVNGVNVTPRLRPLAEACTDAIFDLQNFLLTFRLRLLPSRYPMDPKVARLWVDAEIEVPVTREGKPDVVFRYGSLPDLALGYCVYLKDPFVTGSVECIIPLLDILPPVDRGSEPPIGNDSGPSMPKWYTIRPILDGISFVRNDGGNVIAPKVLPIMPSENEEPSPPSPLELEVTVSLEGNRAWHDRLREYVRQLEIHPDESLVNRFLRVRTFRYGVMSEVVPPVTNPTKQREQN